MTKKIEKTFYMSKEAYGCLVRGQHEYISMSITEKPDEMRTGKITISWDAPEKKIELTEAQFDDVVKRNWSKLTVDQEDMLFDFKKELFGKGE